MLFPKGKGFFIWTVINAEGGNIQNIADLALASGFSHVIIKIADGATRYNVSADLPGLVARLRSYGIKVWGYIYLYGNNPTGEADLAVALCTELLLDGLILDVEGEFKASGMAAAAQTFITRLRAKAPTLPVGLSSYRYPTKHPIPWSVFLAGVDFVMPQVYHLQATGDNAAADQLVQSLGEYRALTDKPYIPTGAAFIYGTWKPTTAQLTALMNKAKELGMQGCNFWEWSHTRKYLPAIFTAIAAYQWPVEPDPDPDPEPEPNPDEEPDMTDIYSKIDALKARYPEAPIVINVNIYEGVEVPPDPGDGGEEPPPGKPADVKTVKVAAGEKANGFWQVDTNGAGKPMLAIKRKDNGYPEKQWPDGTLEVRTPDADVDGTTKFYEVYGFAFTGNEFGNNRCYVKLGDVDFI